MMSKNDKGEIECNGQVRIQVDVYPKADAEKNEKLNRDLSKRLQQSNEHLNKLRGVFAKIDLTMEALTNAQGLEDRIDNAVEKLINRIENETTPPSDEPADTSGVSGEDSGAGGSGND